MQATRYFSAKKFFGTKNIVGKDLYRGSTSASPTEEAYFQIWVASIAGGDPTTMNFLLEIEYIAVLTEPKFVDQSI